MMRLADLNPKLFGSIADGVLTFDCPLPAHEHRIRVPLGTSHWTASGAFPDSLSLHPSVDASAVGCWHGFVTNGEVR